MTEKTKTYAQLNEELSQLIAWFESDDVDLDKAIIKYDEATKLIEQMEKHLKTTENKIKKITANLG